MTVADIEVSCQFYETVLGMQRIIFADNRIALAFGQQKINLHQVEKEIEPKAIVPTPGSADLCFIVEDDISKVLKKLHELAIPVIEGPVVRTGARHKLLSIYIRDPDNNLLELANEIL